MVIMSNIIVKWNESAFIFSISCKSRYRATITERRLFFEALSDNYFKKISKG